MEYVCTVRKNAWSTVFLYIQYLFTYLSLLPFCFSVCLFFSLILSLFLSFPFLCLFHSLSYSFSFSFFLSFLSFSRFFCPFPFLSPRLPVCLFIFITFFRSFSLLSVAVSVFLSVRPGVDLRAFMHGVKSLNANGHQ
jgi:hypothetical protein